MSADRHHAPWYRPTKARAAAPPSIDRIGALVNEILSRRMERDEEALVRLLAELVIEAFSVGRRRRPKTQLSAEQRAAAVADYCAGLGTIESIAVQFRVAPATLHHWVSEFGRAGK